MKRDAETVRLVADVHQHFERLAVAVDVVGQRVVREIDLLDALGQTDDRYFVFQSEPLQRLVGESELSLAAVDDDQLGKLGALGEQPAVAAADHLFH